jgi:hypothetical protein
MPSGVRTCITVWRVSSAIVSRATKAPETDGKVGDAIIEIEKYKGVTACRFPCCFTGTRLSLMASLSARHQKPIDPELPRRNDMPINLATTPPAAELFNSADDKAIV